MSTFAVTVREGTRLIRSSPTRSAIIWLTIAAATAVGVREGAVAVGCLALSVAVVVVVRRSPRPERIMSANAWSRAGAGEFAIWMSAVIEGLILAWTGALVGGLIGVVWLHTTSTHAASGDGRALIVAQLCALGLAACLPTSRLRTRQPSNADTVESGAATALRVAIVAFLIALMARAAIGIRSDSDLSLAGAFIVSLLVIVGLVAAGPTATWMIDRLETVSIWRSTAAITARLRTPASVRFVIVTSVTVATAFAILGASVQARPDTTHLVSEQLARLPVLPRNVALVRLNPVGDGSQSSPFSAGFTAPELTDLRTAIARVVPGATTIELHAIGERVSGTILGCNPCDLGPFIVADARLRNIYGSDAKYPIPAPLLGFELIMPELRGPNLSVLASTRVPTAEAIARAVRRGEPLPLASFANTQYFEVPAKDAVGLPTTVSAMFIRAPRSLTNSQLTRVAAIATALRRASQPRLSLIGPQGELVPPRARLTPFAPSASLRQAPWAATSAAARWAWAGIAVLIALTAMLVTLAIDTIDRRRDVQRLERIGATSRQIRGAAAAHTAALLVTITWISTLLVIGLVKLGTDSFNRAEPTIPVPFTMPWAVIILLTLGLPAIAAALAALIARPAWLQTQSR